MEDVFPLSCFLLSSMSSSVPHIICAGCPRCSSSAGAGGKKEQKTQSKHVKKIYCSTFERCRTSPNFPPTYTHRQTQTRRLASFLYVSFSSVPSSRRSREIPRGPFVPRGLEPPARPGGGRAGATRRPPDFSREPAHPLARKNLFLDQSPHILPKTSDSRNNHRVAPSCNPGGTGRKACISGFSLKRWGWQKVSRVAHGQNTGWKQQADSLLLQERLKWHEIEDQLSVSFLPLDSSLKNSSLWRRIRASFSLHKKKKILSENESLNGSAATYHSVQSPLPKACNTPFTQKLGYSICPSSSMVLLSSMTSLSILETTLTDAEKVYRECQQEGPVLFEECISQEKMPKCEKIGEGVFGEVFKTETERGTVALKIIPIEGSERVNGEPQKTFTEILPEIIISKELSLLANEAVNRTSGFIRLYSVHCVQGTYPEHLLNAWDEYHRLRQSENNRPDFFSDQQLFMVLEFEFGGTDLENMRIRHLNSVASAKSILHQVTASLAVAEEALRFEHRDLHWGNVLVRKTTLKEVAVTLNGEVYVLPTQGILVNIIDYTFSRLERDGLTVFCDLSTDEEVFQGGGDYQFDIYRQMREENANNWADYFPHSNILWLHYLANKLLKEVTYKKKATSSSMKHIQKQLRMFSANVLNFKSATELLQLGTFFQ
uniref:Serine/threonine-protein kinase haspin n=1 Tax=Naja naja TaxID=35670 RepID=A0A8C6VFA4_NAJNA